MQKTKYFMLFGLLFFLCLDSVYATCSTNELNEFKRIKDDYKVTYEFNQKNKTYTLYFNNPNNDKFGYTIEVEDASSLKCTTNDNKTIAKCPDFLSGDYVIDIIGKTKTCDDTLKTINLHLPKYNTYSEDPLCEGLEDFYLCDPTYEKDLDRETFESRIANYKKQLTIKKSSKQEDNKSNEVINNIKKFLEDNLVTIIVVTIFIILLIITIIMTIKSSRKSRWLE
ncbi:MAG: hypothetical protein Q4C23_03665 [Mycoplasmatota bacterium]|nr:hypothetical protein [Mycoplasmatota bacterium]